MPVPSRVLPEILRLDPERDHQRICYLSVCFDFPWDTTRSLELALFRTYCVPRMTSLLVSTGEFVQRAQKRYDDTVLLLSEMLEYGYDSERGRVAQRRMNRMHGRYPIANQDFLYVLSTFVFEPLRWNARYGWRPWTEHERQATFHYWREVGRRMNIRDIPDTIEAFERFNVAYERSEFRYAESNRVVGDATLGVFRSWFPRPLWPLVDRGVFALLDEPVLAAFGYPRPTTLERRLVETALRARGRALRALPRRRRPRLVTGQRHRSYPHGYRVEALGALPPDPPRSLAASDGSPAA